MFSKIGLASFHRGIVLFFFISLIKCIYIINYAEKIRNAYNKYI